MGVVHGDTCKTLFAGVSEMQCQCARSTNTHSNVGLGKGAASSSFKASSAKEDGSKKASGSHNTVVAVVVVCFLAAGVTALFTYKARAPTKQQRYCSIFNQAGAAERSYEMQDNGNSAWADTSITHGSMP